MRAAENQVRKTWTDEIIYGFTHLGKIEGLVREDVVTGLIRLNCCQSTGRTETYFRPYLK